jgi:hypothetical protein
MRLRALLAVFAFSFIGSVALTGLAPWFNPCIGAPRFVDCVDPLKSRELKMQTGGTLYCNLGICDYFPSTWERVVQISTLLLLIGGAGALAALCCRERRALIALMTAGATIALSFALAAYMYPHGAA